MKEDKILKNILKKTKHMIFPQLLKDWKRVILENYMNNGVPVDELYDVVMFMNMHYKKQSFTAIKKKITEKDYDTSSLLRIFFPIAFYCKDGPELFRKVFGARVVPSVEKDLKGFEHNHRIYLKQLEEGRSK